MRWWGRVKRRLDVLTKKSTVENELDEEMRFHVEMETREHMATGLSFEEARRRALRDFGGVERFKEQVRDVRGARWVDDWKLDTRVAARSFAKQPTFLLAVVGTLALGIGGNVAMIGVFDAVLLRELPYPAGDRLVMGRVTFEGEIGNTVSAPDYYDYRDQVASLASLAAYTPFEVPATLTGVGEAERLSAPRASPNLLRTLGIQPVLGRGFTEEEGEPGGASVVLLTRGFWERRFGADPGILNSTLTLDGVPTTVVGVLPESMSFGPRADVWRPMVRGGPFAGARQFHNWVLVGRLSPGVDVAGAQAEVDGISGRLAALYPDSNRDKGLNLTPLRDALAERTSTTILLLSSAMVLLLVIACANVGGVLLARRSARGTELAIRASLGAGLSRLLRQLLAEGALLVAVAGLAGVALGGWVQRGILTLVPIGEAEVGISLQAVAGALSLAVVAVVTLGVLPAVGGVGSVAADDLRGRGGLGGARSAARFRSGLVVAQVALTVVLLMMSGLLGRSLSRLYEVESGFESEGLLTAEVHLPPGGWAIEERARVYEELRIRILGRPEVTSAGIVDRLPIRDGGGNVRVAPPAEFGASGVFGRLAYQRMVLPGYFEAMGIPLLAGRDVTMEDDRVAPNVIVVSEALAADLFGAEDPLGRQLGVDVGDEEPWVAEVIGVVGDVVPSSLAGGTDLTMYFSYAQRSPSAMRLAVRTRGQASELTASIRSILREIDPAAPLSNVAWMSDVLDDSLSGRRAIMVLLGTFAVAALLLSAFGLYGVLAYQVVQRTREIGVRMALGSSVSRVTRAVVRSGLSLVTVGLLVGVPAAWLSSGLVEGLLFGVSAVDPLTYGVVALFMGAVGGLACALPARRAARVDPVVAFRAE